MKPKEALAGLLFLSFLPSSGIVQIAPEQAGIHRKVVICYGWYSNSDGTYGRILEFKIRKGLAER